MNKQTDQIIKNQKPTELDVHLKYRCPKCEKYHWLSLREVQTKGFIIVCDCNTIIRPRLINDIKIKYITKPRPKPVDPIEIEVVLPEQSAPETQETIVVPEVKKPEILIPPEDFLNQSIGVLQAYGFTNTEAKDLIHKTYQNHNNCTIPEFIKFCLKNISLEGVSNNG